MRYEYFRLHLRDVEANIFLNIIKLSRSEPNMQGKHVVFRETLLLDVVSLKWTGKIYLE